MMFLSSFCFVQSQNLNESILSALKTGNAKELSKFLNNSVDITIKNEESVYSNVQAEFILKDFFLKNSPSSFIILHKGNTGKEAMFFIGNLVTNKGIFRTYIYLKKNGENNLIQEINFEEEKK